ncbi:MAG: F0F1 ATP synthase subunit A [Candidatus Yonathbacteria bacterium]|nr:F0F1 ATP synthase subunit A [Candidatus Yonathbacteria bacterium]NTW47974.1 F0F1 ATP synthase subunit A [Candidatus Yonathbacteria bacterium]
MEPLGTGTIQQELSTTVSETAVSVSAHTEETLSHGHTHTLYAEPIFSWGDVVITNTLLSSWIVVLGIIVLSLIIRISLKHIPGRLQAFFELVFEQALELADGVTGSRQKSRMFFPLIFALFLFILLNNWIGIIPGVGSVGMTVSEGGHETFISFLRGGSADLNTTLALATIAVVASHIFGILAVGAWRHINKFINIRALIEIPQRVRNDPTVLIVNPINVFVGLVEIVGELAKIASLSFRLFGNVFAGEVLLASMSAILAWGLPIPFLFLEVFVGLIQATIFAILVLSYLSMHTSMEEH